MRIINRVIKNFLIFYSLACIKYSFTCTKIIALIPIQLNSQRKGENDLGKEKQLQSLAQNYL